MTAILILTIRAAEDMESLHERDLRRVWKEIDLLCDFPLSSQIAEIPELPELRRCVAGNYLIFYDYDEESRYLSIYSVRHGRRKPPTVEDILPET